MVLDSLVKFILSDLLSCIYEVVKEFFAAFSTQHLIGGPKCNASLLYMIDNLKGKVQETNGMW